MTKHIRTGVAVAALAAAALCARAATVETTSPAPAKDAAPAAPAADTLVASGKGFEIKRSELDDAVTSVKAEIASRGQTVPDGMRASIEWDVLQDLVFKHILLTKGTDADKTAGKADYDKFMEDVRTNMSEAVLSARIKSMGMTMEQFKVRKLDDSICSAVFDREVKSKIDIAAETVKKFYEDNPDKFEKPERVRASHILISTLDKDQNPLPEDQKRQKEKLARDIKAKADKGEDFAALAKQYSEDPGSKDTGGEYTFGRGEMVPAFETAAFSLKTNQISDLVETRFGYHIIKLSEKIPGGKVAIAEVSDKIKDYLLQKEVYNRLEGYRAQIEKEAEVKFIGIKEPPKPDDLDISSLVPSAPSTNSANGADKK